MRMSASLIALLSVAACSSSSTDRTVTEVAGDEGGVVINGETLDAEGLRELVEAGGTEDPASVAFAASLSDFEIEATTLDILSINNTAFEGFPVVGSADYAGFVRINAGPTANLGAEIDLAANFETGDITGEQTSAFFGTGPDGLEEYEGEVEIFNGRVGARGIANNARIDIEGTISNDVNTVVVDAAIVGKFIGTPIVGLRGEVNAGDQIVSVPSTDPEVPSETRDALTLTLNGEAVTDGSAGFVAFND